VRLEGLGKLIKIIHLIGSRTRELPDCSTSRKICNIQQNLQGTSRDTCGDKWLTGDAETGLLDLNSERHMVTPGISNATRPNDLGKLLLVRHQKGEVCF
jgi:hypothetical protein